MMKRLRPALFVLATLSLAVPASAADPVARTEALVNAFKAVKAKPKDGALSDADRQANAKAFAALDGFFDYERITKDPIAQHQAAFTPEQMKKFLSDFREVIRLVAYPDSGAAMAKATYKLKAGAKRAAAKEADVEMSIRWEGEDTDTKVTFHWHDVAASTELYDVSFDGASLVKDYKNQFTKIIDKDKVEGLMKKLAKKLDEKRKDALVTP